MEHQLDYDYKVSPSVITLEDQIHEKIMKAKGVLTCVMFATEYIRDDITLDNSTVYHALWVVDEYLDEIAKLKSMPV